MRDLYLVALVLLAGIAGTVVQTAPERISPQARAAAPAIALAAAQAEPEGPLALLCSSVNSGKCDPRPEFSNSGFQVVIAFVPDPVRTNLRLYFDRSIEAITNAAQDNGYTLFRYSLPWPTTARRVYQSLADQNTAEAQRRMASSYPGLLAFRHNSGGPPLAIFLVGESPTEGYRAAQLDHALDFETQVASGADSLRVMGPSFSGTLSMLERAVATEPALMSRNVTLYSGTATTGAAWDRFNKKFKHRPNQIQTATFLRTNEITSWALNDFLEQRLNPAHAMAWLSEGGTVFGNDFYTEGARTEFRFPRGLSHVRQAFQKDPALSKGVDTEAEQDRLNLTVNGDTQEGRDQIPEFAADSPVSHGAELGAISDALQHEQLQYAAVVATDTLDLLFVATYMRAAAPDIRLVLLDADLLQTIPSTGISLQGSLVVSTYPIYAESQRWMNRDVRVYSSQFEEAVYSATASLVGTFSGITPNQVRRLRGDVTRSDVSGREQAVFWISAIGKDALWPVALRFQPDVQMPGGAQNLESFKPSTAPRYWLTLAGALSIGIIGFLVALVAAHRGGESPYQWCADFSLHPSRRNLAGRGYYLSGIALAALGIWLSVTACQIGFFLDQPVRNFWHVLFPASGTILVTSLAVWLSRKAVKEFRADPGLTTSPRYVAMFVIPWAILLSYTAGLANILWPRTTEEGFFFSLRALDLGSGVCPALPYFFLSIAFGLFSWTQLQRIIFAEERCTVPPALDEDGSVGTLQDLVAGITVTLRSPLLDQPTPALWSSLAAFAFTIAFGVKCLRSLEGQVFDYSFAFAVAALCFGLVLVVLRFWNSWRRLQALLEQLDLHPIREAFGHLPDGCSWSPIWQQNPRKRNYQLLARSIEALQKIPLAPEVHIQRIQQSARELLDREALGSREKLETYQRLQNELADAAEILTPALAGTAKPQIEVFFALRYLTYIRYVMLHLRNLATFVTFGYVLLAFALGSYPFLAPRAIAWFLSLLLIGLGIPVVLAFLEMSRNAILTKLTDRATEGKSDWGFTLRTASFASLPVLSMLGSHFPFIGRYVFSWLQPALKSLH